MQELVGLVSQDLGEQVVEVDCLTPNGPGGVDPSSPYLNWTTVPMVFLTVPSAVSFRSSRAETSLLCMYPDLDVLTAVSTRPSLPPMAWKKNSVGERPDL